MTKENKITEQEATKSKPTKSKIKIEDMHFTNRDEFERKKIAENIIDFFINPKIKLSPIVLDGEWGTGKTEFCYKLKNLVEDKKENLVQDENKNLNVSYVNAFQFDYVDEPLGMIISSIEEHIPDKDNFCNVAIPLMKILGKTAIRAIDHLVLKDTVKEAEKKIKETITNATKTGFEEVLDNFGNAKEIIESFQEVLKEIASKKPILIIIDELDRCRPTFALTIIEKVKHIFDIDNVYFLFSVKCEQLEKTIKSQYGTINAKQYLGKFFAYSLTLPTVYGNNKDQNCAFRAFNELIKDNDILMPCFKNYYSNKKQIYFELAVFWESVFKINNLSLRDAETFHKKLSLFTELRKKEMQDWTLFLTVCYFLFIFIYTFKKERIKELHCCRGSKTERKLKGILPLKPVATMPPSPSTNTPIKQINLLSVIYSVMHSVIYTVWDRSTSHIDAYRQNWNKFKSTEYLKHWNNIPSNIFSESMIIEDISEALEKGSQAGGVAVVLSIFSVEKMLKKNKFMYIISNDKIENNLIQLDFHNMKEFVESTFNFTYVNK